MKYLLTGYEYTDEYGLSTSIVISDNESTVTTPYGEVTTYKFYNGLIYEILKDNSINYYAFDNNKLIVNSHIYNEPNKIGGRLTNYVIYQNDSTLINDETLNTYPLPIYQNERGIVFEFDETEKLTKRFDYKGRKGEPVSTVIYYQLYDFDDFFGYVNFTINFYTSSGRKLLTTSPTISYGDSVTDVWRLAVLSAVTDVDYDYFEVEVIARGFYSRIYLYIDAYVCCLADTYNYQNNKLVSSLTKGVPQYIFYNDKGTPIGDGNSVASYNDKSQLIYQSDLFGNTTEYSYDSNNRLISSTFIGDNYKKVKSITYPNSNTTIQNENEINNLYQINNAGLLITNKIYETDEEYPFLSNTYSYNGRCLLLSQSINGYQNFSYNYNSNNDITSLNNYSYTYDNHLLSSVSYYNTFLVSYTYDSLKRVVTKQYLNGTYSFSYDNKNRISTIQYNNEDFIQYTYDDYFGRVTSINEDAFIYDEFSNIKTISNSEYTKRNIIDYRTNQLFQNIDIANSNLIISETSNNTSNDYADLVNELIATSEYSTFFRRRKLETVDGNLVDGSSALINSISGDLSLNNNYNDGIEYNCLGTMSYVKLLSDTFYFFELGILGEPIQTLLIYKSIKDGDYIEIGFNVYQITILFSESYTRLIIGGLTTSSSTSFVDGCTHIVAINIGDASNSVQLIVDGSVVLSLNYQNIYSINDLKIGEGTELFGLILNTCDHCFDNQTIIEIYNNYRKIIQKQSDNLFGSVHYPAITTSSTLPLSNYEYFSFDKTYNSSFGKKPLSITYPSTNRDEDGDFVFDKSIMRYVYSTFNKTLKYTISRYSNGTASFFVKPLDANQAFIKLGILEIGINNQRKLYLKVGTTTRTSTSTFSQNKYYSIVATYSFVTSTKCNLAIYLDGVSAIVLLNATTSSLVAVTIPSGKSYIKDLCFANNVIPLSQISSFINKFKNNARHVSFCNSLNLIQKEQMLNDSSVIVDSTYTYQRDEQNNKKERISMIRKETSELTFVETYSYDVLGRVISMNDRLRNSFAYDENFQLSNASIGTHIYSYEYNDRGNIIKKTIDGELIDFTYDNVLLDRLSQAGSKSFTYFASNPLFVSQITDNETAITLSYQGRNLKTYEIENDKQISFEYNYNNLRTKKIIVQGDDITTYSYYYDLNNNLVKQVKTDNNSTQEITFLRDSLGLYGFIYNNNQYFYIKNLLGIIYKIIDINGNEVVNYEYDPYGKLISATGSLSTSLGSINPYIYKEYYYDFETELYYLNSRYYDPDICRFISPDSVDYLNSSKINGLNLYAYCNNDPVNYCDPSGHSAVLFGLLITFPLLFTPIGGLVAQMVTSAGCYADIAFAAIWNKDVREDMNAIGWNPFNSNESKVLSASAVSFYKGIPVFMDHRERSGTFTFILLDKNTEYRDDDVPSQILKHEYGHTYQQMILGPISYLINVGLPSWKMFGNYNNYYDRPIETMADMFGGASVGDHAHTIGERSKAIAQLIVAGLFGPIPISWFFFL
ncbi:MAG: hypothetical protein MJ248_04435 [Bacilli bacterium]|nr:hypothetical protein [Bacilli bacterium]